MEITIGTRVPLGGNTGINLEGTVTKIDGDMAKVEADRNLFSQWYTMSAISKALSDD